MVRKLRRVHIANSWLGGVCGGIAYWMESPAWLVRTLFVLGVLCFGVGLLPYIVLWVMMPKWAEDPADYHEVVGE